MKILIEMYETHIPKIINNIYVQQFQGVQFFVFHVFQKQDAAEKLDQTGIWEPVIIHTTDLRPVSQRSLRSAPHAFRARWYELMERGFQSFDDSSGMEAWEGKREQMKWKNDHVSKEKYSSEARH